MPEKHFLLQMKALPLRAKVLMSYQRIREWYDHFNGNVCISFSGGKDSTVLAHLVHEYYPDVPMVFANTGLEYPEIQSFARKMGAEFVRPKMLFSEVISKYGYPIISKENAEAIYFARRIRNSGWGGGTSKLTARRDLLNGGTGNLSRLQTEAIYVGGGVQENNRPETAGTQRATSTGWEQYRSNGRNKILHGIYNYSHGGGTTHLYGKRTDMMNLRNQYYQAREQAGSDGEEIALPG